MIRQYLRKKFIFVNNKVMIYPNYILPFFEFLSLDYSKRKDTHKILRENVRKKTLFFKPPFYLEVNFRTFTCLVIQTFVTRNYVRYPFKWSSESLIYLFNDKK